jgi:formylglycine-generating enzyme required for sulfatase activity
MSGNVWEWCLDDWHDSYKDKPDHLKNNGNEPWGEMNLNKNHNSSSPQRGGSWSNPAQYCRSAFRNHDYARCRSYTYGFRVTCVVR